MSAADDAAARFASGNLTGVNPAGCEAPEEAQSERLIPTTLIPTIMTPTRPGPILVMHI